MSIYFLTDFTTSHIWIYIRVVQGGRRKRRVRVLRYCSHNIMQIFFLNNQIYYRLYHQVKVKRDFFQSICKHFMIRSLAVFTPSFLFLVAEPFRVPLLFWFEPPLLVKCALNRTTLLFWEKPAHIRRMKEEGAPYRIYQQKLINFRKRIEHTRGFFMSDRCCNLKQFMDQGACVYVSSW